MGNITYPAAAIDSPGSTWKQALALEHIYHLPSLSALLSAVMPAGLPLTGLRLHLRGMPRPLCASQLLGCSAQLAGVTALELVSWAQPSPAGQAPGQAAGQTAGRAAGQTAGLLAHMLEQCPRVVNFAAVDCGLDSIPEPLAALLTARHLTCLDLSDNCLRDLPPGDYLSGAMLLPSSLQLCGEQAV